MYPFRIICLLVCSLAAFGAARLDAAVEGSVRVSVDSNGRQYTDPSGSYGYAPSISDDGSAVAFQTLAEYSPEGDANGMEDVYLRRLGTEEVILVSVSSDGAQGNNRSYAPDLSADGNLVAFESMASNLVPGDGNNAPDVYLRDLAAGTTVRVSTTGSDSDGGSTRPAISGDGARVAFCSRASNLVDGDDNGVADVFVYSVASGSIERIPVEGGAGALSGGCLRVAINNDGSVVAYATAGGGRTSVYVWSDGEAREITPAGDGPSGASGLAISGDGRLVVFDSEAANLVDGDENRSRDVFVYDTATETIELASERTDGSRLPGDSGGSGVAISRDGEYVVFGSSARQVVQGDTNSHEDVFRRSRQSGEISVVSVSRSDRQANNSSYSPDVDGNGSNVAFTSLAGNMVLADDNATADVFVRGAPFPPRAGEGDAPFASGAPEELPTRPLTGGADDGIFSVTVILGAAGALGLLLVASWFLLGVRTRA